MNSVTCHISMSLDGFVAGTDQSLENPIGKGGMRLHEWAFATDSGREQHGLDGGARTVDSEVIDGSSRMSAPPSWVVRCSAAAGDHGTRPGRAGGALTRRTTRRSSCSPTMTASPLSMQGGTTFTFVTDGIESALERARKAAGDKDVAVAGGASACSSTLRPGCSTSSTSTSFRSSSGMGDGCSRERAIPPSSHQGGGFTCGHPRQVPRCPTAPSVK